jgi:glycosyltransferase involved in cell wall biosynthesis
MKILIVEFTSHQKKIPHLYKLFSNSNLPQILIHKKDKAYLSNIPEQNIITSLNISTFDYFILFFKGFRYERIFISTGPEYISGIVGIIHIMGFYLFCRIWGNKTILNVLNSNCYIKNQSSFSNKTIHSIRVLAAKYLHRFTFEGLLTLNSFKSSTNNPANLLSVSSIYYSDIRLNPHQSKKPVTSGIKTIGLTGRIDPQRKDYNKLFNVLKKLSDEERSKIQLLFLGECNNPDSRNLIKEFEKLSTVTWFDGYLSDSEFESSGLNCDVLFSPLPENFGYGITKETGAFGDAIYLHKKVIIPQFSCTNGEFDPISIYYDSEDALLSIFRQLISAEDDRFFKVDETYLSKYSTTSIFRQISADLHL